MMAAQKQEAPGARQRFEGRITNTCASNSNPDPFARLLARLEGVQHHGNGVRCICPGCGGKSRKLSLTQGDDGRVLLHCFAGCSPHDVLAAVGLTVNDLFVRRIETNMTPAQKRELREHAKQAQWRAALDALLLEIGIVHIAARQVSAGDALNADDLARVGVACDRIRDAREVLNGRH